MLIGLLVKKIALLYVNVKMWRSRVMIMYVNVIKTVSTAYWLLSRSNKFTISGLLASISSKIAVIYMSPTMSRKQYRCCSELWPSANVSCDVHVSNDIHIVALSVLQWMVANAGCGIYAINDVQEPESLI